ncbi:hypothetical protein OH77DRAFT_651903 [Trametes cingulata]|nr:hypothetical protein OH77DRAFT_651903 [Trametes cingulata]
MSSKLLTEPLASASPSKCPTPARTASPGHGAKKTSDTKAKNPAPVHTSERPNWAVAPDEPKASPRSQLSDRHTASSHRGKRGNQRSKLGSNASKTPPATTPNPMAQSPVKKRPQRQQSPEKRSADERLTADKPSARDLRKEKAEPWIDRVNSWVEHTSSTAQTSPSRQNTPAASSGTSPSPAAPIAREASDNCQTNAMSRPSTAYTSPLNPHAPVWEFKPRQRAATTGQTHAQSSTPNALSAVETPASNVSQTPLDQRLAQNAETDLQLFREMLRECGLMQGRPTSGSLGQQRSIWGPPLGPQTTPPVAAGQSAATQAGLAVQNAIQLHLKATGNTMFATRQRTQTHNPLGQQGSWQSTSNPPDIPSFDQHLGANVAHTQSVLPTVRYPPAPTPSPTQLPRMGSAATLGASSTSMNAPRLLYATGPPKAVALPATQASHGSTPVHVGRHPGSTPSASPIQPPGSGRARPPPATSATTAPPARFYGIETPRVVFDKHGWTVNHS